MEYKDYYKTLGVKKDASQEDIQKAYRKLARKFHPDVNKDPKAEVRFKEIGEANEVLKDPDKRKKYDQFGANWNRQAGPPPGWEGGGGQGAGFDFRDFQWAAAPDSSDFFENLFGAGAQGGRRRAGGGAPGGLAGASAAVRRRGRMSEATITISVEEAVRGGSREIAISDPNTGSRKTLTIKIPEGVRSGQKIRLAGQGGSGSGGGGNGNLLLKIEIAPDSRFKVEGSDITTHVPCRAGRGRAGRRGGRRDADTATLRVRIPAGLLLGPQAPPARTRPRQGRRRQGGQGGPAGGDPHR